MEGKRWSSLLSFKADTQFATMVRLCNMQRIVLRCKQQQLVNALIEVHI